MTGSPLRIPYAFYRATFTMAPHFVWQSPRPAPEFHHRVLRDFYQFREMGAWADARSDRPPYGLLDKLKSYWRFYLGPVLSLPLIALPPMCRRRRIRFLMAVATMFSAGLAVEVWHAPHYAAPAMSLILLLAILAVRQFGKVAGRWATGAVLAAAVLTPVVGGSLQAVGGHQRALVLR